MKKEYTESSHIRRLDAMAFWCYCQAMSAQPKRATVYFSPEIHRALRYKAAETERSVSDLVNDAVRASLVEDAEDLAAFEERAAEPSIPFERVVRDLRRRGKI